MTSRYDADTLGMPLARKLLMMADLQGDGDGFASDKDVFSLSVHLMNTPLASYDLIGEHRRIVVQHLVDHLPSEPYETLPASIRKLPLSLRRLALEISGLWGRADGEISLSELERVARFYLFSWPFFAEEAFLLSELAEHLQLSPETEEAGQSFLSILRDRLEKEPTLHEEEPCLYRQLFDEVIVASEIPGSPELIRDIESHSPKWHSLSILEHIAVTIRAVFELSEVAGLDWEEAGATMLLHDIGKILNRQIRLDGIQSKFTFWEHEQEGTNWLRTRGIPEDMLFQIQHHGVLRENSVGMLEELTENNARRMAQMVVVYGADQLGKGCRAPQLDSFESQREKIRRLSHSAGFDGEALLFKMDILRGQWFGRPSFYLSY